MSSKQQKPCSSTDPIEEDGSTSEEESSEEDEYVSVSRTRKSGGSTMGIGEAVMNVKAEDVKANMGKAQNVLDDEKALGKIMKELDNDKDGFEEAVEAIQNNVEMQRTTASLLTDPNLRKQLQKGISKKQQKKMAKKVQRIQKYGSSLPNKGNEGYNAVNINNSRKMIKYVITGPDFLENAKYDDWEVLNLGNQYYMLFDPKDKTKNRLASRIANKNKKPDEIISIGNSNIIYMVDSNTHLTHLDVKTAEEHFK